MGELRCWRPTNYAIADARHGKAKAVCKGSKQVRTKTPGSPENVRVKFTSSGPLMTTGVRRRWEPLAP